MFDLKKKFINLLIKLINIDQNSRRPSRIKFQRQPFRTDDFFKKQKTYSYIYLYIYHIDESVGLSILLITFSKIIKNVQKL